MPCLKNAVIAAVRVHLNRGQQRVNEIYVRLLQTILSHRQNHREEILYDRLFTTINIDSEIIASGKLHRIRRYVLGISRSLKHDDRCYILFIVRNYYYTQSIEKLKN